MVMQDRNLIQQVAWPVPEPACRALPKGGIQSDVDNWEDEHMPSITLSSTDEAGQCWQHLVKVTLRHHDCTLYKLASTLLFLNFLEII